MSGVARALSTDSDIDRIGAGLVDRTLPGAEWTHAAHWAAAVWLIVKRGDLHPPRDMPGLIRAYNESLGNRNTDRSGYHERSRRRRCARREITSRLRRLAQR